MPTRRRHGFTLIELLVVIAIIAILAAILFPVFAQAREKARQTACLSNMNQIGKAIEIYAQDYDEFMPPSVSSGTAPLQSWPSIIYPYIKSQDVFACPSAPDAPLGSDPKYTGVSGQYVGLAEDSTVNATHVCMFPGSAGEDGGDGSTMSQCLVHKLSYSRNVLPDASATWANTNAAQRGTTEAWGNNDTAAQAANLHKSGFAGFGYNAAGVKTYSTVYGVSLSKVEAPSTTIHIFDGMVKVSTAGGANCYPGSSLRAIQADLRLDFIKPITAAASTSNKPAPRHSGGYNALYGDGHAHWKIFGTTKPCDWTIQDDNCP